MCGKKICLFLLILSLAGPAAAQDWDIKIPSVNKPPAIDGQIDSIWSIASVQYISTRIDGTVGSPADCSGSWRAMWDAEYLYVIVDVNDDMLVNDSGNAYQDDSVEVYFDGGNSKGPGTPLSDDDRQYTFGWTATDIQGTNTDTAGVVHAQVDTPTGWRIEIKLPWMSLQGAAPAMDDLIGIDVFINDDDNGADTREAQVATFADDSGDWQVPSDWGTGLLVRGSSERASGPSPANGATDVPRDVVLGWVAGEFAAAHSVYFGTTRDDVNEATASDPRGVLVGQGQADTQHDPDGLLEYGQTYYWRIDEVNAAPDEAVFRGEIWSFTAEPYAYPITNLTVKASSEQPTSPAVRTIDRSGLDEWDQHSFDMEDMWMTPGGLPAWIQFSFDKEYKLYQLWVWNANSPLEPYMGLGARDVAVEYSTDGQAWTPLENVPEFAQGTSLATYTANTTVDFGQVMAKYVKLTINDNWGTTSTMTSLSEVRFLHVPVRAFQPDPADGATEVDLGAELNWRPGREATSHEVYFGTDADAVAQGTVAAETVTDHRHTPDTMNFGTVYYWKVNEVGDAGTYEGDLWSLASQEYEAIDDFDGYTDDVEAETTIWHAWIDGQTTEASGSTVGYWTAPFAETSTIHGGTQSMPFAYDNTGSPYYFSEAEREFDPAQDWTGNGATELSLWVRGYPPLGAVTVAETSGKMDVTGAGEDIWGNSDQFTYAYKTLVGDGMLTARVVSIGAGSNTWAKGGVMIRDSLNGGSAHTMMALTANSDGAAGNGASFQYRETTDGASANVDSGSVVAPPYYVRIQRQGDTFTGYVSPSGTTWTTMGSIAIEMEGPVYIGLCVTSHAAGENRTYQFDNIAFTGTVTGAWQGAAIDSPVHNAAANMYLVVEDSSGNSATATNATVVTESDWTQWKIPMTDLAGVNLGKVKKMVIGVGDRTATTPGGAGRVFIDDIGYGHSAQ